MRKYKTEIKKVLTIMLTLLLFFAMVPGSMPEGLAYASEITASGECGEDLTWELDQEGVLTVSGTGDMYSYRSTSSVPWYKYRNSIIKVVINDGVTSIGDYSFCYYNNLESIDTADSVTSIGKRAFYCCKAIKTISLPSGLTTIGDLAFGVCSSLTSINIPESVTSIGDEAFSSCSSLESIVVSDGNQVYDSRDNCNAIIETETGKLICGCYITVIPNGITVIGDNAFSGCQKMTSITIPESVTKIGANAFLSCSNLVSITIPEGVRSIEEGAFSNCSSLENLTINGDIESIGAGAFTECVSLMSVMLPSSITSIEESTFSGCSGLEEIVIPDTITSIGDFAFTGCNSLTNIDIPDSVTSIGNEAFSLCVNLIKIIIPKNVTSIGTGAFLGCDRLENIIVSEDNPKYDSRNNCNAIIETETNKLIQGCNNSFIPTGIKIIGDSAFDRCTGLTSIVIPDGVESIGAGAFGGCNGLTEIDIPDGVISIGEYAFSNCAGLERVAIPSGVTSIRAYTFHGCTSLVSVNIPDSVTSIGEMAFYDCSSLVSVTIPESVTSVGYDLFSSKDPLTIVYAKPDSFVALNHPDNCEVVILDNEPVASGTCGANLTWELDEENVLTISGTGDMESYYHVNERDANVPWNDYKFSIKKVIINDGVTSIGDHAFHLFESLEEITIPESVTRIGDRSFNGCISLTSVNIPKNVTSIGMMAFNYCKSMKNITISENVTSIGDKAFSGCGALESIVVSDGNTVYDSRDNCNALIETETNKIIRGSSKTVIPQGIVIIGDSAFSGCEGLLDINIPESVTSIGDYAFSNCSSLTSFTIPGNITSISEGMLCECYDLEDVIIHDGVTSIGNMAFYNCHCLESITIPESVTSLGYDLFSYREIPTVVYTTQDSYVASNPPDNCEIRYISSDIIASGTCGEDVTWKLDGEGVLTISGTGEMDSYYKLNRTNTVLRKNSVVADADALKEPESNADTADSQVVTNAPWSDYRDQIKKVVIDSGVTSIGDNAFNGCTGITNIDIADSVTSIGEEAFGGCASLESVEIPDSVTTVGNSAFTGCASLESVTIPESVTSIGEDAFAGCESLTSIFVHEGSYGDEYFNGDSRIEYIDIIKPVIDSVTRIYGSTRYETSIKSADAFKEQLGIDKFDAVILADGRNYADALAGSYLSCVKKAPILLVRNTKAEIDLVQNYIKANLNPGGTIYMLGGSAVVPDAAVAGLSDYKTNRLWGTDRYATNVEILKEAGVSGDEILVASGTGFADSLSASATGKPILLVKNVIQPSQKEYVETLKGKKFYLIGGTGAVNQDFETYFKGLGTVTRIAGATRYDTSANVAKEFFPEPKAAVLAFGTNFPDGLCGGSVANAMGGPLLLATSGKADQAAAYAKEKGVKGGAVLGGPTLISDADTRTIFGMAAGAGIK